MPAWIGPDLGVRRLQAELMDDPGLDATRHVRALRALGRVNRVSLTGARVWREVQSIHRRSRDHVKVLDLACGGGDVLAYVARRADRAGVPVELAGCDVSAVALEEARRSLECRGRADGGPVVTLLSLDLLRDEIPGGYDLVTSSLFLHHLTWDDAVGLLRRARLAARDTILIQDLRRTRLGYALAWLGLHVLTGSDVARIDGLRSVRAAFTDDEARTLLDEGGLGDARLERAWPQRFVARWSAS